MRKVYVLLEGTILRIREMKRTEELHSYARVQRDKKSKALFANYMQVKTLTNRTFFTQKRKLVNTIKHNYSFEKE